MRTTATTCGSDPMAHEIDSGVSTPKRVRRSKPHDAGELVTVASTYSLPGVGWDYYNTVYKLLGFRPELAPGDVRCTLGWQDPGHWRTDGLWRTRETEVEQYFGAIAVERISQAVQLLGAVPSRRRHGCRARASKVSQRDLWTRSRGCSRHRRGPRWRRNPARSVDSPSPSTGDREG